MASRERHTLSLSWSSAVAGIWRSVGGPLSSSLFQYRIYNTDRGQDGRAPPSPSPADPLSGQFSKRAPTTQTSRTPRPVYDRNAYPLKPCIGFRVYRPILMLSRTALKEEERLVRNYCIRASRNMGQVSCHDSPKQGFDSGKELPIGSACVRRNIQPPSACITSEAIAILKHRRQQGLSTDSYMFVEILKGCSMQKDLTATREVHNYIIQSRMHKQRHVATTLLNVYIKCGSLHDARRVFDGLEKTDRNVITWTVMIGAYAKSGRGVEAFGLFLQMQREGFEPNAITYVSILNGSASAGALEWVKEVHGHAREAGLESDLRVCNALVHMYAKCGSIDGARLVFDRMEKRDVITWNTMIGAYAESGSIEDARLFFERMEKRDVITWNVMIGAYAESGYGVEAYRLFLKMKREGFIPDAFTYSSLLNASASARALEWVKGVHSHAREAGLESGLRVGNALVHMYCKSGSMDDARLVFDRMEKRDVVTWTIMIRAYAESGSIKDARLVFERMEERDLVTWNTMIGGLAQHGRGREAQELFRKMNADSVKPDGTTFVAVLSACCHAGLVNDGRRLFLSMAQDYGIAPTVVHYNCMVDLLGRAGHLKEAKLLIDSMSVEPDAVTWNSLLGACRTYSNLELGEFAAKEALKLEPKDAGAYVLLSNIYAAAGKWEKVSSVRTMMRERGVRKEPGRSWIEVDNKIHDFVVGDTSHPEVTAIYSELKKLTEQLKAKGYIPDTKLVLHNIDEEDKELALCSHSEKLAIAYGLLRVPRGKSIRVKKNLRVCSDCHAATKLISEVTGREIIVRDANRFHHFKDGVCSCGDYW